MHCWQNWLRYQYRFSNPIWKYFIPKDSLIHTGKLINIFELLVPCLQKQTQTRLISIVSKPIWFMVKLFLYLKMSSKNFVQKNFVKNNNHKICWVKNLLGQIICWVKKFVGSKIYWEKIWAKNFCCEKKFWVLKIFWVKKNLGQKKCSVKKNFGSKKFVGQKNFCSKKFLG